MRRNNSEKKFKVSVFHKEFGDHFRHGHEEEYKKLYEKIISVCIKSNFDPTLFNIEKNFKNKIEKFGLDFKGSLLPPSSCEVLVEKKRDVLLIIKTGTRTSFVGQNIHIIFVAKDDYSVEKIIKSLEKIKDLKGLREGTYYDYISKTDFDEKLAKLSPQGKILDDKKNEEIFISLYELQNRDLVKQVKGMTGFPLTKDEIREKIKFDKKDELLKQLINKDIFSKTYRFQCKNCERTLYSMDFKIREDAQKALESGSFICPNNKCRAKQQAATIAEVFFPTEMALRVSGGSWLEKLVDLELKKYTPNVWSCRVFENDEFDNVFVFRDKTTVVECKDTSFGQKDLYNTIVKARNIEANKIIVVTTENLHNNVSMQIKKVNENEEDIKITVINGSEEEIIKKIGFFFERVNRDYVSGLFESRYLRSYSPTRYLRRR